MHRTTWFRIAGVALGLAALPAAPARAGLAGISTVGTIGSGLDLSAIAFDSAGNLYAIDSFTSTLLKVNKATAAIVGSTTLAPPVNAQIGGLAFDTGDANLYFAGGTSSVLYKLDR